MLELLKLFTFQAHETVTIELAPVTVIVGPTDTGKTSAIRGLRWLCLNVGRAESFIRHGSDGTEVQLVVDGHLITRSRYDENLYVMDGIEYRAFHPNVPQPIADVLNVTAANFQMQHDAAYWLASTGGEVSRQLNAVVDLGIIDESLANAASATKTANAISETTHVAVKKARQTLEDTDWVDAAAAEFQILEGLWQECEQVRAETDRLCRLMELVDQHQRKANTYNEAATAMLGVAVLARDAHKITESRQQLEISIDKIRQLESVKSPSVAEMEDWGRCYTEWDVSRRQRESLEKSINFITAAEATIKEVRFRRAEILQSMPETCPICGGVMNVG